MGRDLFLTGRQRAYVESEAADIAAEHGKSIDDIRDLIHAKIAPHPPLQQCKDAIEKVRRELEDALKPREESRKDA